METQKMNALMKTLENIQDEMGPEMTVRQLLILLHIARAGSGGTDALTLQNKTSAPQASVSRTLDKLGIRSGGLGLVEAVLDPADYRRRVLRIRAEGEKLLAKLIK